ncbi:MAG: DUF4339 domain-containing protein [Bacteroidia bacterium]|nr:DUF4339 domain-containing protein [Bacteroidia bacterium]
MKIYFLHNGTEQQGPFDIEDLKTKNINKKTPIWHEGLENWTTADKIGDLKELFETKSPPPFNEPKITPPPISKTNSDRNKTDPPTKRKRKTGTWVVIGFIATLLIVSGIMVINNPNAIPGVKVEINTPKPIVITSRADGSKSGLFKARTTVWATVQNQGGAGNVLVTFHVYQDGYDYDRSKQIYLQANESQDLNVTFDEVKMLGGDITYNVEAK